MKLGRKQLEKIYKDFIIPGVKNYLYRHGTYPAYGDLYDPNQIPKLSLGQLKKLVERAINEIEAWEDEKKHSEGQ